LFRLIFNIVDYIIFFDILLEIRFIQHAARAGHRMHRGLAPAHRQAPALRAESLKKEHVMQQNVGIIDRTLRIILGLALIGASLAGLIGVWGWIGIVPLATGLFRFCPAYLPFGWNTCKLDQK
jgi:hypothetical protein